MSTETADLLLQLGRSAYADCAAGGMTQAQWIAIRFFSRANRFSRTISGFAQYHVTTRGTASQTVKILVDKGYLVRTPSERDARSIRFDLTALARRKLSDDPLESITQVAGRLSADERTRLADSLRTMLADLRRSCRQPVSGICRLCSHLDRGGAERSASCRLMREPLAETEFDELCVRYVSAD
jgi:DNA-binding MarR family transcriptional regulator